ncbi:hypothetical protein LWI29_015938 [Acer saccharum]|uniref:WAT1-related protein n=1 Tax=Acer saccharum TaxID=4024 RepID=A0AA39VT46_ACESA|nr:hypothetical protein LWI29_015938 [Acer saccharum]
MAHPSSPSISLDRPLQSSNSSNWVTGGLLFTVQYILVSLWYIVLAQIMKEYPAEITVVFIYNTCVCFLAAIVGSITERDLSAWRPRPDIALASILRTGLFGSVINAIHAWGVRMKGPVYVAMFKPLSIVIAVAMGVMFLGDTLHLGSVVGATIISLGFYTLMWGKAKEEMVEDYHLESPPAQKVPLLQSRKNELV